MVDLFEFLGLIVGMIVAYKLGYLTGHENATLQVQGEIRDNSK